MTISRTDLATAAAISTLLTAVQNALTYCTTNSFGGAAIVIQVKLTPNSGVNLDTRPAVVSVNLTLAQTTDILTTFSTEQTAALVALGVSV